MDTKDAKIAYSEVIAILNLMEDKYKNKIPQSLLKTFEDEKKEDYIPKIDVNESLAKQNLQRETLVILAMLNLNYWCESEEEKEDLIKEYSKNDKKKEEELRKKYNPDDIFKNNTVDKNEEDKNNKLVEYKENVFIKIWNSIRGFFRREK